MSEPYRNKLSKDEAWAGLCGAIIGMIASFIGIYVATVLVGPVEKHRAPSLMPPVFAPLEARRSVDIQAYFSPGGGCTEALVGKINASGRSIYVQAYSFTSVPIADALIAARDRGVDVQVIVDRSQKTATGSQASRLVKANVPLWYDCIHAIAHNKIMVIDDMIVVGGSFNYTSSAEHKNAENMTVTMSPALASIYKANWIFHREHSEVAGP